MEKLYILRDGRNFYKHAYIKESTALNICKWANEHYDTDYRVEEFELPFIGRSVCYVDVYCGFDYFFGKVDTEIRDINLISPIYSSIDQAKESELWQRYQGYSQSEPSDYIITDTMIASRQSSCGTSDDVPFYYGDSIEDKFNMQIRRIRVIRI